MASPIISVVLSPTIKWYPAGASNFSSDPASNKLRLLAVKDPTLYFASLSSIKYPVPLLVSVVTCTHSAFKSDVIIFVKFVR